MFEKIEIFDKRYSELSERLYQPSVAGNPEEYQKIINTKRLFRPKKTALKFLRKQATKSLKSLLRSSLTRLRIISKILRKI